MKIDNLVKVMVTFTPFSHPKETSTYHNHEVIVINESDPEVITRQAEEFVLDLYDAESGSANAWHAEEVDYVDPAVGITLVDEKPKPRRVVLRKHKTGKQAPEPPQIQLGDTGLTYRVTHRARKMNGEWKTTEVTVLASKAAEAIQHATKAYGWTGGKTTVARIPA